MQCLILHSGRMTHTTTPASCRGMLSDFLWHTISVHLIVFIVDRNAVEPTVNICVIIEITKHTSCCPHVIAKVHKL